MTLKELQDKHGNEAVLKAAEQSGVPLKDYKNDDPQLQQLLAALASPLPTSPDAESPKSGEKQQKNKRKEGKGAIEKTQADSDAGQDSIVVGTEKAATEIISAADAQGSQVGHIAARSFYSAALASYGEGLQAGAEELGGEFKEALTTITEQIAGGIDRPLEKRKLGLKLNLLG